MTDSDPFKYFDQEERSHAAMADVGPALAKEAVAFLRDHPGTDLVGLAAEWGTAEHRALVFAVQSGASSQHQGCIGVLPREIALDLLTRNKVSPTILELLEEVSAMKDLPIVICTKNGHRVCGVDLPAWEEEASS